MINSAQNDERVAAIVSKALRQPPAKRESYLRFACNDDPELYQETAEAVKWEERMGSFLLLPANCHHSRVRLQLGRSSPNGLKYSGKSARAAWGWSMRPSTENAIIGSPSNPPNPAFIVSYRPSLKTRLKCVTHTSAWLTKFTPRGPVTGEIDFLTMEFLEGETLSKRLAAQGKLPNQEALEIACQLCAGLAEAHRSDVLHRDFKSANIILCSGSNGVRAVITDFGLASDMTQSGEMGGTPRYMAPELWRGEKASKASDIYALGVVLYEMVAGQIAH